MLLKKILFKAIVLIICLYIGSCQATKTAEKITLSARLVRIVSGQTIEVTIPELDRKTQQIRMIGIDAPLEDTLWSERVQTRLKELIADSSINLELESSAADRYNRIFAHVWQNNILISEQLAKEGYVIANTQYPHQYSERIFHSSRICSHFRLRYLEVRG